MERIILDFYKDTGDDEVLNLRLQIGSEYTKTYTQIPVSGEHRVEVSEKCICWFKSLGKYVLDSELVIPLEKGDEVILSRPDTQLPDEWETAKAEVREYRYDLTY